ncbi:MAG TPA: DUF4282 domain-containing protein [Stenotrophobium sp.]|nr:DUF4282 domain-containing protein [Stenotrophobium sp.]
MFLLKFQYACILAPNIKLLAYDAIIQWRTSRYAVATRKTAVPNPRADWLDRASCKCGDHHRRIVEASRRRGRTRLDKDAEVPAETPAEAGISWRMLREEALEVLRNLFDVRLRTIMTTRMAPTIYVFLALGVIAVNLFLTIEAFQVSLISGLVWLLLIMPIASIVGVITVRVILESLLSLFRIVLHMETLMEQLHTLRGQTESIAERVEDLPLPRIQFWRSRKRADTQTAGKASGGKDADQDSGDGHGSN